VYNDYTFNAVINFRKLWSLLKLHFYFTRKRYCRGNN